MNKIIIFFGFVLGTILLFQFGTSKVMTDDVFELIAIDEQKISSSPKEDNMADYISEKMAEGYHKTYIQDPRFYNNIFSKIEDHVSFDSTLKASIVPYNLTSSNELGKFFERLKETQDVKTFIIVHENHYKYGNKNITTTRYGFETPFGNLEPNLEIIDELINTYDFVGTSFYTFKNEFSLLNIVSFIKAKFPDANVVPIAIKDSENSDRIDYLAEFLSKKINDETIILLPTMFAQNITGQTAKFHNELSKNVINNFDYPGIDQMDVDARPAAKLLFSILDKINAKKSEILAEDVIGSSSYLLANFYEGEISSNERALTIMAFGDMMLGRHVRTLMDANGKDYIFENIKGYENRFFEGADVIFANLEGPIKGAGRSGGTSMVFGFNEDVAPFLKKYGFTLFSLANNHAVDQGWDGRDTTISALDANYLSWCGHPSEADPNSVHYSTVGDKKYAFLCFHDVTFKLDDEAAVELVKTVRPNVDYLIVSIHWGYEYKHKPDFNTQISPGHAFIDAGADFVIGHHPHVVQSFEEYKDRLIFYSLGNFVFDQYWSEDTQIELGIGIVLDDHNNNEDFESKVYLFPMKSEAAQSRLMTQEEYNFWIEEFITYGDYSDNVKEQIRNGIIEVN